MNISIRKIEKVNPIEEISTYLLLIFFYSIEMRKNMGWSVKQAYFQLQRNIACINEGLYILFVAENEEKIAVGLIIAAKTDDHTILEIQALCTAEPFRKKGIAKALMDIFHPKYELYASSTPAALSWYKKNGFKITAKNKDGTIEVTTSKCNHPKYNTLHKVPIPTEQDMEIIKILEHLQRLDA